MLLFTESFALCNPASLSDSTFGWMIWSARIPALHCCSVLFFLLLKVYSIPKAHSLRLTVGF